uniref:uncharacterized protein LOC120334202 n=1 Tax=Styela clava TaxID=7725 RepID=UPI0019397D21|nr:uncharacterized protein LOC120334202 [Styela clava]
MSEIYETPNAVNMTYQNGDQDYAEYDIEEQNYVNYETENVNVNYETAPQNVNVVRDKPVSSSHDNNQGSKYATKKLVLGITIGFTITTLLLLVLNGFALGKIIQFENLQNTNSDGNRVEQQTVNPTMDITVPTINYTNETSSDKCSDLYSGFKWDNTCYWAEINIPSDTNLTTARQICSERRSKLSDIYSKAHYDMAVSYLRSKIPGNQTYTQAWTNMRRGSDGQAKLSDGTQVSYQNNGTEASQWAIANVTQSYVYILVDRNITKSDQGMGAGWSSTNLQGALCQT